MRLMGLHGIGRLLMLAGALAASPLLSGNPPSDARKLDLHGKIEPPERTKVMLFGVGRPFRDETKSDAEGRFQFQDLKPGSYTVALFHPRRGELQRTVEVTESFADQKGRVSTTVRFKKPRDAALRALEDRHTVSLRQLSIKPEAWRKYQKAQRKMNKQDWEAARKYLRKAVEVSPQFAAAWNNLGTLAYQSGDYVEAEKYFRRALTEYPESFEAALNLGGVLLTQQQLDEALQYNKQAIEKRPESALANAQTGINYFFLEQDEQAVRYLEKTKELDPFHFTYPRMILAEIHERQDRPHRAIDELEQFLKSHPDSPRVNRARRIISRLRDRLEQPEHLAERESPAGEPVPE